MSDSGGEARRVGPSWWTVVRDSLSFLGGWYLIVYQAQFAETFNVTVFLGGMVMSGVPGAVQVWQGLRPGGPAITDGSSAQPPQSPSSAGSSPP